MSAKKFKFVSPGIFIKEIDNSQLPRTPEGIGPIVIGRSERGPAMRPVRVESFAEFVELFGNPISGGRGDDVFRTGNYLAPTYAAYAAQAWLRNQSPLTFVRLLGVDHEDATGTMAGWKTDNHSDTAGAFGLFVADAPADPVPASAELELAGLSLGEIIGLNEDADPADAAADVTVIEQSAVRQVVQFDVNAIANLQGGAAEMITIAHAAGGETRSYVLGNLADGAVEGLKTDGVADAKAYAEKIRDYINEVDNEVFTAFVKSFFTGVPADDTVVLVASVACGVAGPGALTSASELVGGGVAVDVTAAGAAVDAMPFNGDALLGAVPADPDDGAVSLRRYGLAATLALIASTLDAGVTEVSVVLDGTKLIATANATGTALNGRPAFSGTAGVVNYADGSDTGTDFKNAALAAIIYNNGDATGGDTAYIGLNGEGMSGSTVTEEAGAWVKSVGDDYEFQLVVKGSGDYKQETINFNLDATSEKYIRKVLNTNPTLCQDGMTGRENKKSYWLGESFDRHVQEALSLNGPLVTAAGARPQPTGRKTAVAGGQVACLVELGKGNIDLSDHVEQARPPRSGWVASQHLGKAEDFLIDAAGEMPETVKLFRLHGLYSGEWDQKNLKISIEDIKPPTNPESYPYGSFTLSVRRAGDSDKSPVFVERFTGLNLDPNSPDYISARIGDMETYWIEAERRYRTIGQYDNSSQFVRVEVNPDLEAGLLDPALVPFGFYGPPKIVDHLVQAGSEADPMVLSQADDAEAGATAPADAVIDRASTGFKALVGDDAGGTLAFDLGAAAEVKLRFPKLKLRKSSREGGMSRPKDCYWGVDPISKDSSTKVDAGYGDYVSALGAAVGDNDYVESVGGTKQVVPSFFFSLDDIQMENEHGKVATGNPEGWAKDAPSKTHAEYLPENHDGQGGLAAARLARQAASARRMGTSLSAGSSFAATLSAGFDRFTMPMFGGQDGLDLREKEPFRNSILENETDLSHYAFNSIKRAIDICADPEVVECNIMTIPGIYNPSLTDHLIQTCEARADALAIIDLEGDYKPNTENTESERSRLPDVPEAIQKLRDRVINSSYGCAYFPWVQIRDTINNQLVWAPPSVVALGTMSNSQRNTALWFAPAGFTRGGLSNGSAGLPVVNVRHRLNSEERDALYEANVNPIASFPAEGIVVFGQKTLQVESSALDRINVRRLMIYLKKEISRMAATVLFDQNVQSTWGRFTSKVNPFLNTVKSQFGLSEYRVILDETTTTPDLIDRNIMYAKIMLKPTRAIEFIAIDFVITDSGASFDD